jgi:hypothetical protein
VSAAAHSGFSSVQQLGFDKAQQAHLNSQIANIALDLRKNTSNYIDGDGELRLGRRGSLAINPNGCWYDNEAVVGDRGAISLTTHLMDASPAEVRQYLTQRLAMPRGTFAANLISDAEQEAKDRKNAEYAHEVLQRDVAVIPNNATYKYFTGRGLDADHLPPCVMHLDVGREHECAAVGILTTADGEVVGVQIGHITIDGVKSIYLPERHQFLLDKEKAKDGAFRIAATPIPADTEVPELIRAYADTVFIVEGIEDAVTLHQVFRFSEVWGLPGGIGRAVHMKVNKGTRILVFTDGDDADAPAQTSLEKGTDALILAGAVVQLAGAPAGSKTDANDLLRQGGVEAIHAIVAAAVPAKLSVKGHYLKAARTPDDVYQDIRKRLAKEAGEDGIRVTVLDQERARLRQKNQPQEDDKPAWATWDESLWPAPITDIAGVLDSALNETKRYVFGHSAELAMVVVWCLLAHFMHHGVITLPVCPRLAIKAAAFRCGKTTLLEVVENMVPRPEAHGGALSEATFRHLVDEHHVCVLIDEADSLFRRHSKDGHLLAMLKSGHRRSTAHTMHMEPSPDGRGWQLHRASTWAPLAYTQVGRLLDGAMEDRALSAHLPRARRGEVADHLVNGASPELRLIRQKFARWAADQTTMPDIEQPDFLYNRDGDNWMPLLRLAHLIGGAWPDRILSAARLALGRNEPEIGITVVGILHDIREAFGERAEIATTELIEKMRGLPEQSSEWDFANGGRPITATFLAKWLRTVDIESLRLTTGKQDRRGYTREQFTEVWDRYLQPTGDTHTAAPGTASGASGPSEPPETYRDAAINPETPERKTGGPEAPEAVMRPPTHVFPDGTPLPFDLDPPTGADDPADPADDVFRIKPTENEQ